MVALCMMSNYYGKQVLPDVFNKALTNAGFFYQATMASWYPINKVYPDITCTGIEWCGDVYAPMDKIDNELAAGRPVVVCIDYDHNPGNGPQTHYVLIFDKDNGRYKIADPYFGDISTIKDRYCNATTFPVEPKEAILQVVYFSGPQATDPLAVCLKDRMAFMDQINKELNPQIETLKRKIAELTNSLSEDEGKFQSLKEQIKIYQDFKQFILQKLVDATDTASIMGEIERLLDESSKFTTINSQLTNCKISVSQYILNEGKSQKAIKELTLESQTQANYIIEANNLIADLKDEIAVYKSTQGPIDINKFIRFRIGKLAILK